MPDVILRDGASVEDTIAMLKKTLSWLMANLDHDNVKRLYTEFCQIQSQNGETQIDGPVLKMYDKQATPVLRLQMGYDPTMSKFVFEVYDPSGKKSVYLDENGTEVLDGKLLITHLGKILLNAFKDTYGGVLKIYDNNQMLDVKVGVQSGTGDNIGGSLMLYIHSPYDTSPASDPYRRVEFAITTADLAGAFNLRDGSAKARISSEANSGIGPYIGVRDANETLVSYLAQTVGFINGVAIATQAWAAQKGALTGSTSHSHTVVVNGTTYTTSSDPHFHVQM